MQDLELQIAQRTDSVSFSPANDSVSGASGWSSVYEEADGESDYWRHLSRPQEPSAAASSTVNSADDQQSQGQVGSSIANNSSSAETQQGEAGADGGKTYRLRAPGQLVAMYLVYFVPLFVVGVAGWMFQHWPSNSKQSVLPFCRSF